MSESIQLRIIAQEQKYMKMPPDRNGIKFKPNTESGSDDRVKAMENFQPDYRTDDVKLLDYKMFGWPK